MKFVLQDFKYGRILRPAGDFFIGESLGVYGEYCEKEIDAYRSFVREGDVVLDIGANIGACTIPLAQMVGPQGKVYAFEPQRIIFQVLCGNVALNNILNVYTKNVCVGEKKDKIKIGDMFLDPNVNNNIGNFEIAKNPGDYEIDMITIDDLQLSKCNFIKCDTEGMGIEVLNGARKTIQKYMPVIFIEEDEEKEKIVPIVKFLTGFGYEIYKHETAYCDKTNYFSSGRDIFTVSDFVYLYDHNKKNIKDILEKGKWGFATFVNKNLLCVPKVMGVDIKGLEKIDI